MGLPKAQKQKSPETEDGDFKGMAHIYSQRHPYFSLRPHSETEIDLLLGAEEGSVS